MPKRGLVLLSAEANCASALWRVPLSDGCTARCVPFIEAFAPQLAVGHAQASCTVSQPMPGTDESARLKSSKKSPRPPGIRPTVRRVASGWRADNARQDHGNVEIPVARTVRKSVDPSFVVVRTCGVLGNVTEPVRTYCKST
jgi:hypothetical protein